MSNRQDDALPELPVPVSTFLCTKCGHSEDATAGAELHPPCSKCGYLGFVLPGNTYTADQMRAYAQSAIASLQARLDAAEKDAARYRWLREYGGLGFDGAPIWSSVLRFPVADAYAATLDACVDANVKAMEP